MPKNCDHLTARLFRPLARLFAMTIWRFSLFAIFTSPAFAQSLPQTGLSSNRFLFVVDTSAAMKKQAKKAAQVVDEIVNSGANGQMHRGDTLGLWTFNEDVASELPVQRWDAGNRERAASRTTDFLRGHVYEKSSRFEVVLPDMLNIIRGSDIIMVFIISNGDTKIKGTPFDAEINNASEAAFRDMRGDRNPIVTILVAKGGKILRYTVNPLPWPIVVPELPPSTPAPLVIAPPNSAPTQTSKPTPVVPASAPAIAPPLIIIGKSKPTTNEEAAELAEMKHASAPTPPPTAPPVTNEAMTPSPVSVPVSAPSAATNPPVEATKNSVPAPVSAPPTTGNSHAPLPSPADAAKISPPPEQSATVGPTQSDSLTNRAMAFVAPESGGRSRFLLMTALALVIIALALIALMIRRSRVTTGPSLITASLRNEKRNR